MANASVRTVTVPPSACGMRLSSYLAENGHPVKALCGGVGKCGKCLVTVKRGQFLASPEKNAAPLLPNKKGQVHACRAFCTDKEAVVSLCIDAPLTNLGVQGHTTGKDRVRAAHYAVALDIGTTTLAASLIALPSGSVLDTQTVADPCIAFGADIISRIAAAQNGHLTAMQGALLSAVRGILSHFKNKIPPDARIEALACVGNTTMLHLFWGISPKGMAAYPFTPAFTDMKTAQGIDLALDVDTVYTLPCATAFFGADAVAGIVETALPASSAPTMLLDLGTNGELALYTGGENGRLYVTSTAAGPAFEGAGISTGVGGVEGAVCRVTPRGQTGLFAETVGGASPIGICGSALIDLIAALRLQRRLDDTGYLAEGSVVYAQGEKEPLCVTQEDIRAFQVAKSAIRAGIDTLLFTAGITADALDTVYLGGGMGHFLHISQAQSIGLLPAACTNIRSVQNCALGGAVTFLKNGCNPAPYRAITAVCTHVELNDAPVFSSAFMAHMRLDRS